MIILLSGRSQAGKSTQAKKLRTYLHENDVHSTIIPLAAPIKLAIRGERGEIDKERDRQDLIEYGTHVARKWRKNIWVEICIKTISPYIVWRGDDAVVIVDDVRFINEITLLKRTFGAHHVKAIRLERKVTDIQDITEQELDDYPKFDFWVGGNGESIEEVHQEIVAMYHYWITQTPAYKKEDQ